MTPIRHTSGSPGSYLVHPIVVASIAVLALNDHVLKPLVPGLLTGKLSDIAGLIFFPILLAEVAGVLARLTGRTHSVPSLLPWTTAATITTFALVKSTEFGGLVYGWGLGAGQWLVSFGFAGGEAIRSVAYVVDPTDLVAIPAAFVGWWISTGGRRSHPWRMASSPGRSSASRRTPPGWVGVLLIVVASVTSLATSQAVPMTIRDLTETLRLTPASPAVVRHISWTVAATDDEFAYATLNAGAWTGTTEADLGRPSSDVSVTVIPDDESYEVDEDEYYDEPGVTLKLPGSCRAGCVGGATIIVRLVTEADAGATVILKSRLSVSADEHDVTLVEDPDRRFDGDPTTITAAVGGAVTATDGSPDQLRSAVLHIDADALHGELAYPLVGRLSARVTVTGGAFADEGHEAWIGIGDDVAWFTETRPPMDRDWLAHCRPDEDCEVEIGLFTRYDPTLDGSLQEPDLDAAGFVQLQWSIEASLEAFDGRQLPDGALRLELRGSNDP